MGVTTALIFLLSQWNYHLNCSNPKVASFDGIFSFPGWCMILNCMISFGVNYILMIGKVVMSAIYCNHESDSLMSCSLWKICSVTSMVCHSEVYICVCNMLTWIILSCFYDSCACPIWSSLCASYDCWSYDVCCIYTVIWICPLFLSLPSGI